MNQGWEQALEVQAQLLKTISGPFWGEMSKFWLRNRDDKYGRHAMLPSAHAFSVADEVVAEAEPIYVTAEMLDLTRFAMETFDPEEEVKPDDFFLRSGFALLEKPFVAIDAEGLETAWTAVSWRYVELPPEASVDQETSVPALEIILWWDTQQTDEWDRAHPETIAVARMLYERWGMRYAVMHATLVPLEYMSNLAQMAQEGDPAASWMTFIRVFNRLLEERIVLKSRMRPHRAIRRSAARLGLPDIKDVVVVELRRAKPRGYEWPEGGGEHAHYSHSFLVRGHWRNQPFGPGLKQRRQQWIAGYVKGEGEFRDKKRVWVWDR